MQEEHSMNTHSRHVVTAFILIFPLFSAFPGEVRAAGGCCLSNSHPAAFCLAAADHGSHGSHGSRQSARGYGAETEKNRLYTAVGVVESVDKAARKVVIAHEPVPALGWPAMTMGFVFEDAAPAEEVKAGDRVRFDFRSEGKTFVIADIEARK
jgi:Cu(I)/Ag(I) efflux system protein CusF